MRLLSLSLAIGALLFSSVSSADSVSKSTVTSVTELLAQLPSCADTCYRAEFNSSVSGCNPADLSCLCAATDVILTGMTDCLVDECTIGEQLEAEKKYKIACHKTVHNSKVRMRAIFWSLYFVTLVSFACRILARTDYFGGTLWWDDWFIVFSFVVATGVTIGAEIMVDFGLGQDIWMLKPTQVTVTMILFYVAEFAYVIESTLTKTSIMFLYLRIFPKPVFRRVCFYMLGFLAVFCLVFVITLLTYCQPFSYVWSRWDARKEGTCINMTAQTYVCAALNIVLDVTIFLLPIPQLLKLETHWKAKAGVILVFMLGLFVTICSITRLRFLSSWASSPNPSYDYGDLAVWSLIELYAGVICACLPGMASLFRRIKHQHSERKKSSMGNSLGGSRGFTAMSSSQSQTGTKSFSAAAGGGGGGSKNEAAIMKTTSVSVSYCPRDAAGDAHSDEMELMERNEFDYSLPKSDHKGMPPTYMPKY